MVYYNMVFKKHHNEKGQIHMQTFQCFHLLLQNNVLSLRVNFCSLQISTHQFNYEIFTE
jgi:hypothetical protein